MRLFQGMKVTRLLINLTKDMDRKRREGKWKIDERKAVTLCLDFSDRTDL